MQEHPTHIGIYFSKNPLYPIWPKNEHIYILLAGKKDSFVKTLPFDYTPPQDNTTTKAVRVVMVPTGMQSCSFDNAHTESAGITIRMNATFVRAVQMPKRFSDDVREYVTRNPGNAIGHIIYNIVGDTAELSSYYPKPLELANARKLGGAGYYFETITTNHLEKQGINFIKTSANPSGPRRKQLEKVELPIGEWVPIKKWRESMGRGIRQSRRI